MILNRKRLQLFIATLALGLVFFLNGCGTFMDWVRKPENYTQMISVVEKYLTLQSKSFVIAPGYSLTWEKYSTNQEEAELHHYIAVFIGDDSNVGKLIQFKCDMTLISEAPDTPFDTVCKTLQGWIPEPLPPDTDAVSGGQ